MANRQSRGSRSSTKRPQAASENNGVVDDPPTKQVKSESVSKIARIFENLEYGPAPESHEIARSWLSKHNNAFGHFINGVWEHPKDRKTLDSKNPATGEKLATTIQGESSDVDLAVSAASTAYHKWSKLTPHERSKHLYAIARTVQKHIRLIAVVESLDNGKPIRETRDCDIPIVARHLYHHAGWAQLMDSEMKDWKSLGVVGAIVPWNFPLMLLCWKVCPALAMGNTMVLKPASFTRLSALLFAEICAEAGLPAGVFNVVTGNGAFGSTIATHPSVSKVAFTGSTEVGKILRQLTAGTGKKLSLELGGKSPVIVFDSADLDSVVEGVVNAIWFNQGQVCSAGSRLLVQESVEKKLMEKLKERMMNLRLGSPLDKCIDMGAIVDNSQRNSISDMVETARREGAEVYQAAACVPEGCYYPPTLVSNVSTVSSIVQDEVFGPVLVVLPFRTAKEAIQLANNTIYGLGASVWSENIGLAMEVASNVKAGTVWINNHNMFDAAAGFGGYRQSGYGRDGGKEGLYEYVKPSWQEKPNPKVDDYDLKAFGPATFPSVSCPTVPNGDDNSQRIDQTHKLYVAGKQKRPDANYTRPITNEQGQVIGQVGEGNRKDIRDAVEAAHSGLSGWSKRSGHNRAQLLYYIAENLSTRREEFLQLMSKLNGDEANSQKEFDLAVERLFHWAAYADKYGGNVQETQSYGTVLRVHEPVGVIGIACPDESPFLGFVSLFAPAFARGNTTVIIPSEKDPLSAIAMYKVFETSDVPAGVINIVTGSREHLTKILVEHQNVNAMWYFGSAAGSKFVESTSSTNIKRTWVNYGQSRDWSLNEQGCSEEFLIRSVECKNIWIPMGHIFAN